MIKRFIGAAFLLINKYFSSTPHPPLFFPVLYYKAGKKRGGVLCFTALFKLKAFLESYSRFFQAYLARQFLRIHQFGGWLRWLGQVLALERL